MNVVLLYFIYLHYLRGANLSNFHFYIKNDQKRMTYRIFAENFNFKTIKQLVKLIGC